MRRRAGGAITANACDGGDGSKTDSVLELPKPQRKDPPSSSFASTSFRSGRAGEGRKRRPDRKFDSAVVARRLAVAGTAAIVFVVSTFALRRRAMSSSEPPSRTRATDGVDRRPDDPSRGRNDGSEERDDGVPRLWNAYDGPVPDYVPFGSMYEYGDKSDRYSELRKEFDALHPHDDTARLRAFANSMRKRSYGNMEDFAYDVTDCPDDPPEGYPKQWKILKVLENWSPDDPEPREKIYQGICRFDHGTEMDKIKAYRDAEVPFVVRDDPEVLRTVERWNDPQYMSKLMGDEPRRTEHSPNNRFMYYQVPSSDKKKKQKKKTMINPDNKWHKRRMERRKKREEAREKAIPAGWTPPTESTKMTYGEWRSRADADPSHLGPDSPHWYHRLIGCGGMRNCERDTQEFLFDELPFFQPRKSLYVVEPESQMGIHCRFGMRGIIAENHFDATRNMIALLGGERRYVLSHPNQCENLALFPKDHPSARHSAVDWSDPDIEKYPEFRQAEANEVVLQAGDVLYLPMNWFHYIVSLETNFQCNTRSGVTEEYREPIRECGF